ncbi:zinc finger MYM-type protein 1-like [Dioscorea cayenensis subsp. rotundata]|uniref:Zinc finger MYM-type protein 1-like n=1 Tax=Dioscorea cayennensis subsp. rotundata TaxID=55577 RepID=A0AB40BVM9_DIOCR|nr:zinc finger MYM-type protein 1-like [Dioscorea cayenensis subsp. rotundata]
MDKFLIKRPRSGESSNACKAPLGSESSEKNAHANFDLDDIISDPGLRKPIEDFDIRIRDQVRRKYLTRGPCQPAGHNFPQKEYGKQRRSFRDAWFKQHPWLEYSVTKDAVFCFWCYLFKPNRVSQIGEDAFTKTGFNNWKKALEKFIEHVGAVNSAHNDARVQFQSFQNQRQSVSHQLAAHSHEMEVAYRIRLTAILDVTRFLLKQGLAFRGHDESSSSLNKGNFLELLEWYSLRNEEVWRTVNQNATGNNQMTSPKVQKELANACAAEITRVIVDDIGDNYFSLLIDEARDISVKEQMGVILRYVNKDGYVIERFLAMVHVPDTSAISLKNAVDCLFSKHKLSLSRLRGQGYDGASNMRGEFNGLKALILKENLYARYVHCFAHQLQLVIVVIAKDNRIVSDFFQYVTMIVNVTRASCKRKDQLRQHHHDRLVEQLEKEEIVSGRGKNQESSLARPGDTRWGSHYTTILRLISMWTSVLEVLQNVHDDGASNDNRGIAASLIEKMENYQFIFIMYLMSHLLRITNELSLALQQKDQNIVQAMRLIEAVKARLQGLRETRWEEFMEEVIDLIAQEIQNHFPEASTELLLLMSYHDPRDSFSKFNIQKLLRLAELNPEDFSMTECMMLEDQLATFIYDVQHDEDFTNIRDLGDFARKMVETEKCFIFPLVYRLLELALVLPVATASVERVFSAMNIVKTDFRNKMGDEWMNDSLVVYIEREVFGNIDNETILQRFQKMQTRRMQLPPLNRMPRVFNTRTGVGSISSVPR